MSSALEAALTELVDRLGAVSAVVWQQRDDRSQVIATSPVGIVPHGAPWPADAVAPGLVALAANRPTLTRAVPAQLRLALPAPVHTAISTAISEANLAFTLIWTASPPASAATELLAAVSNGLDLMAVDLERRVRLAIDHGRMSSVMRALDQAVIVFDQADALGTVNWPAAELLGLPMPGEHDGGEVRRAFRTLRRRAVHTDQFDELLTQVIADPTTTVRDRMWRFVTPTQYFRVSTTPYTVDGRSGRVWTFDDVTSEMVALTRLEMTADELRTSQARYEMLAQHASDIVFRNAPDGTIEWISGSVRDILGHEPESLVGRHFVELLHPDDITAMQSAPTALPETDRVSYRGRFLCADGTSRWLEITARLVCDDDGTPRYRIGSARDAESQVLAERARERSEALLRTVVDGMLDPQVLFEPVRDESGTIVDFTYLSVNLATEKALGAPRSQIEGRTQRDFQPGGDDAGLVEFYAGCYERGEPIVLEGFRYASEHYAEVRYFDIRGTRVDDLISLTWRDVTEQTKIRQRLEHTARTDPLTGVLNRAAGVEVATAKLQARRLPGHLVALLFCDIDHFKELNDAFGHRAGDIALQTMAERIREEVRSGDVVARLGGDEFLVVLDGVHGADDAFAIGEKIRRTCGAPIVVDHGVVRPSMSVGAVIGLRGDDFDTLLARADAAMYVAKGAGRNRVVVVGANDVVSPPA